MDTIFFTGIKTGQLLQGRRGKDKNHNIDIKPSKILFKGNCMSKKSD